MRARDQGSYEEVSSECSKDDVLMNSQKLWLLVQIHPKSSHQYSSMQREMGNGAPPIDEGVDAPEGTRISFYQWMVIPRVPMNGIFTHEHMGSISMM